MLTFYYYELMGKLEEHNGKKYLIVDDYMLDKVLDKIKMIIGFEKFDDTKILIETGDNLPDDVTLKYVILITCVIKDDNKLYSQTFLEEALAA